MSEEWARKRFELWASSIINPDTHMTILEILFKLKEILLKKFEKIIEENSNMNDYGDYLGDSDKILEWIKKELNNTQLYMKINNKLEL